MPLDKEVFQDLASFSSSFQTRLSHVQEQDSLGAFILACANASYEQALLAAMQSDLERQYQSLQERFVNQQLNASEDDVQVFKSLQQMGLENLAVTERRRLGPWSVQFNSLRGLRPSRHAGQPPGSLQLPFAEDGFHFNKPFMHKELFWQGEFGGHSWSVFYNKFPFADYHLLWVPDAGQQMPQYLSRAYHRSIWQLVEELAPRLPGFTIGYNALGASASVNHLHFQSCLGEPLGITQPNWRHNGGEEPYPLAVETLASEEEGWQWIDQMHGNQQTYNLLYTDQGLYGIGRRWQGSVELPAWSEGFAWREMAGEVLCIRREDYLGLTREEVEAALGVWRLEP